MSNSATRITRTKTARLDMQITTEHYLEALVYASNKNVIDQRRHTYVRDLDNTFRNNEINLSEKE